MELKVELVRHIGKQRQQVGTEVVEFDVDFKQFFVQANGRRVGIYCGMEPGKHLAFTEELPQAIQDAITEKVKALVGGVGVVTAVPREEHEVINDDE